MKKLVLIIVALLVNVCCFSQINVFNAKETNVNVKKNPLIYFLPKTTFVIKIKATTETFYPGPYSKYAEKYLCIKNAGDTKSSKIKIDGVCLSNIYTADQDACFLVDSKNNISITCNNTGVILGYNTASKSESESESESKSLSKSSSESKSMSKSKSELTFPIFTDYGVKRNFTGNTDTTY
ncbi:MAG: DUF4831 family protein, partial [Bacteroidales bacterium]|nr:DUF4831 family protein [Bacteroidales bacterium]